MTRTKKPLRKITPVKERLKIGSKINKENGCLEWLGHTAFGYGLMNMRGDGGKWRQKRVHRLAYQEHVGEIPEGMLVCHHCDNRRCINTDHLFVGTTRDNAEDRDRKGRGRCGFGEGHGMAKLTNEKVILIRQLKTQGATSVKLAARFGVGTHAINRAISGSSWAHVHQGIATPPQKETE